MYQELDKVIAQPTELNNMIILYTELVTAKLDEYVDKTIASTAFGREGNKFVNYGNDFIYLLGHLLSAYYYSEIQTNAGVTYGETEVYADYGLEAIREYFYMLYMFYFTF